MLKSICLTAVLVMTISVAQAAEPAAVMSIVKGSNVYQSRIISDVRPDQQSQPEPSANPVSIEPASGADDTSEEMMEGRDALQSLQDEVQNAPQN